MSSVSFFLVFAGVAALVAFLVFREKWLGRAVRAKESAYIRGLAALIDGHDREALDLLKDAVREDSGNIDAYIRIGEIYRRNNRPQQAYQIHRTLLVRGGLPATLQARIMECVAQDLLDLGSRERAREVLADLERIAGDPAAQARLAALAERAGEWEKAYEIRRELWRGTRSEEGSPGRVALYRTWTACQALRERDGVDVREELREALKLDSTCVPAHLALGDVLYLRGELDDAIHHWRRIVDQHPRLAFLTFERLERAFFDRGTLGRGTLGDLEAIYDRLLRDHPDDTTTLEAIGNLHHKRGEVAEAIAVYQKALELSPRSRSLRRRLVRLLHENKRYRESEQELEELLKVVADGAEDRVSRARESAAYHPLWECSDLNDWDLFAAAFEPPGPTSRPRRR